MQQDAGLESLYRVCFGVWELFNRDEIRYCSSKPLPLAGPLTKSLIACATLHIRTYFIHLGFLDILPLQAQPSLVIFS